MFIVDSQIHLWARGRIVTDESAHHRQSDAFNKDAVLEEMDEAGVDRVIIVPPGWLEAPPGGTANDHALLAAREHPDRFTVMGKLRLDRPDSSCPLIDQPANCWRGTTTFQSVDAKARATTRASRD